MGLSLEDSFFSKLERSIQGQSSGMHTGESKNGKLSIVSHSSENHATHGEGSDWSWGPALDGSLESC